MAVLVAIDAALLNMLLSIRRGRRQDRGRLLHTFAAWSASTITQHVRWTCRGHT